jgi:transcription factor C subunit 6
MSASNNRTRRSGRARSGPKKYSVDAFDQLADILSHSSGDEEQEEQALRKTASDDEFDGDNINDVEQDPEEEIDSNEGSIVEDEEEPAEGNDEAAPYGDGDIIDPDRPTGKAKRQWKPVVAKEAHSVGLNATRSAFGLAKLDRVSSHIGPGVEDLVAFVHYRDVWLNKFNFPSKENVDYNLYYPPARRAQEATEGFKWYYESAKDIFHDFQRVNISSGLQSENLIEISSIGHRFLAGNIKDQTPQTLQGLKSLTLRDTIDQKTGKSDTNLRKGWILNLGKKIQCLEWVPNRTGKTQLLTISYFAALNYQNSDPDAEDFKSPFRPLPSSKSELYFWEIAPTQSPKLRAVISYDWNHLKNISWCPCTMKEDDDVNMDSDHLGLLAGVWLDGRLRILDISIPKQEEVAYIHIATAAFEVKPPDTIITSLTWLSPGSIAASCADGHVAIWNISQALGSLRDIKSSTKEAWSPRPWFYKQVHDTYIVSIVSGYPSRPWAIFTNSLDGYARLTDIRDPEADYASLKRVRVNRPSIVWHDATQQMIISDDNWDITSHYLRVFPTREIITRWTAMILDIAQSSFHSSVLVGCADGSVGAVNVARRMKRMKHNSSNAVATRNFWFRYEWRDAVQQDWDIPIDDENPVDQDVLNKPLGRFLDGFKGENIKTANYALENIKNGQSYNTVYQRETAVTNVCWNPNLDWATWAAAATGTGLIRIEDIGIQ